ncbi:MAG: hypothetical protein AAF317_12430 [Pseudomonadota bacterium]
MYRLALITAASLLAFAAIAAQAEESRVYYPFMAGSLHEGPFDMVYYVDPTEELEVNQSAPYELYATFLERDAADGARRDRYVLRDGEQAEVTLPGHPDVIYRFRREAHRVHATVEIIKPDLIAVAD